jgi:hypothetical protein
MRPPATLPLIQDQASLLAFLSDYLDWPIPVDTQLDEITFDWTDADLRLSSSTANRLEDGTIHQFQPLVPGQPFGIFLVEFNDPKVYRTALRQIVRALVPSRRKDAKQQSWKHGNLLFICVTKDFSRITFAHFRGDSAAKAKLSTFGWSFGSTYFRTLFEFNIPQLQWPKDASDTTAWIAQWTKAFDKEPLTKEFFKRFDAVIDEAKKDLEKFQKLSSAQAYSRAQMLIERMIFLYFLQNRGWLDQKKDFLLHHYKDHRGKPTAFSYYEDFLEKLFFTLATPPNYNGPGAGTRLSAIPFLNGGLFDDDEFAQTAQRKKDNPPLRISNQTFAYIFDHLLEAFNFTVREDTPLNQDVAVDPEMLGKVFESIVLHAEAADPDANAPDKRKATGSYYTPRIVVHFICRESLRLLLLNHASGDKEAWGRRLRALLDLDASDGLDKDELAALRNLLSSSEAASLLAVVEQFRCLDPSVGSGAFPVGLLHELVNLRRLLRAAADGFVDPVRNKGQRWIHETKAHIVENGLYGVDIQQQAIEICRLRLWLSLIVDYDLGVDPLQADRGSFLAAIKSISQLPNLEMNFRRGDSLLDYISGIPVRVEGGVVSRYRDRVEAIQKRGHDLHKARRAEKKKELRLGIMGDRLDLAETVVRDEIKAIDTQASSTLNWFGESDNDDDKKRQFAGARKNLAEALVKISSDRRDLEKLTKTPLASDFYPRLRKLEGADFDSPFNFVWNIDYAEIFSPKPIATLGGEMAFVNQAQKQGELLMPGKKEVLTPMEKGGFDLVVGNPPFVTARNPIKRELYRMRWAEVCHMKFLLICPFFDLSFGLLRAKGQLGFIVSNAFAKREFGLPLIQKFFPKVNLQKVIDCSGLMFPGHGTPTCIVFGGPNKPDEDSPIRVAAILPGGGDLRTPPEESTLWHTLAKEHENPGFSNNLAQVSDRSRKEMGKWPWSFDVGPAPTKELIDAAGVHPLRHFLVADIGFMFVIGRNDIFMLSADVLRRNSILPESVRRIHLGEEIRNYEFQGDGFVIFPYEATSLKLLSFRSNSGENKWFSQFEDELSNRPTFAGTFASDGRKPHQFHQLPIERAKNPKSIAFPEIATHAHFTTDFHGSAFNQKGPLIKLPPNASLDHFHVLIGTLNTSSALFWLKQVCFNKGAGEDEHRDRFEFAGGKVQQLPVPQPIADALIGKPNKLSEKLAGLASKCSTLGRDLPSFALRKLFEQPKESYQAWDASLPGYALPATECKPFFATSDELRSRLKAVVAAREARRVEMIALQEEMDWLCYVAYGLIGTHVESSLYDLAESDRPFRYWAHAGGDFSTAIALIPAKWSKEQRHVWVTRLELIRDNEHIRRIEAPVYKRRWDEQWKVSNRWMAGPVAYAQELVDAFSWWLAGKAEWFLENTVRGGPIALDTWTSNLWKDKCIAAAWPVVAESLNAVEVWKTQGKDKKPGKGIEPDFADFAKFFRATVNAETVPDGIPPATPWEELEKKGVSVTQAKKVRGKLNVPRERFRQKKDSSFIWAGDLKKIAKSDEISIPIPNWMDRPIVLPSGTRVALEPARYRSAIVPQLLFEAGGKLDFEKFRKAYWLLTEPAKLERFAKNEIGAVVEEWKSGFCDKLDKAQFFPHLRDGVKRQLEFIRVDNNPALKLRNAGVSTDSHVIFDARLALLASDLWPSNEPIEPLTPAEQVIVCELEAVE